MHSSFLAPIPAAHSERRFNLRGQLLQIRSQAHLQVLEAENQRSSDTPLIQNYYCQQRSGQLLKVTIIRIGREVLRLTDKITLSCEPSEEDDKTKYSTSSSQSEPYSYLTPKHRKPLSKSAKTLLSNFQQWAIANEPESHKLILILKEECSVQEEVVSYLANSGMRDLFLAFSEDLLRQNNQIRIGKLATQWMKRCLTAREHERMKQEYIEEVLEKM